MIKQNKKKKSSEPFPLLSHSEASLLRLLPPAAPDVCCSEEIENRLAAPLVGEQLRDHGFFLFHHTEVDGYSNIGRYVYASWTSVTWRE